MRRRGAWAVALCALAGGLCAAAAGLDARVAEAARNEDWSLVRSLIAGRSDVNAPLADGMTPLDLAVRANESDVAELLIRAGADANTSNRYGITPLALAATNGNAVLIEMLLRAGANPSAAQPSGETVLMTAARTGDAASVKALLAHGADPNAREKTMGETALMWAAAENHGDAIRMLVEFGADKNARSTVLHLTPFQWVTSGMVTTVLPRGGWTPLMYAARQNATGGARALAEAGADLNATDPDGSTALVLAVINAHFDLAAMLLDKGADPNVADDSGMAALYAAVDMHTLGAMLSRPAPKLLDELDSLDLIKLLLKHGADPNARLKKPVIGRHHDAGDASLGEGTTALMRAAKTTDIAVMNLLLQAGANPYLTQKDRSTVIMIVAGGGARAAAYSTAFPVTDEGAIEAIKLCLARGVDIDAYNLAGQTALHRAAARGANKLVQFLADSGAKLDMKDKRGRTPADLAAEPTLARAGRNPTPGHTETRELLLKLIAARVPQAQ
jgi:ankyrin repeat protein